MPVAALVVTVCALVCPGVAPAHQPAVDAGDSLAEIRRLYEAAEYERALGSVDDEETRSLTAGQARDIRIYEALCLLALGKKPDAEAKIEAVLQAEPLYEPSSELPKRLQTLVNETRTRLRPSLAQAHYDAGKELFEAKKYDQAVQELDLVLQLTDVPPESSRELRDLRRLASGFRDLAERSATAPQPSAPEVPAPAAQAAASGEVIPPVVIRQNLPPWPAIPGEARRQALGLAPLSGVLEVVVTRTGAVDSVRLIDSIEPVYDNLLLNAAKRWKYLPATQNGQPVEFVKRVAVNIR
jgi:TonB family protein